MPNNVMISLLGESREPVAPAGDRTIRRVALDASQPLRLDGSSDNFVIVQGYADLFAVATIGGELAGPRLHITRVSAGEAMLGLPHAESVAVIAVGGLDTDLEKMSPDALIKAQDSEMADRLDRWVALIGEAVFGPTQGWSENIAEPGVLLDLAADARVRAGRVVGWAMAETGALRLGESDLTGAQTAVPIAGGLWLRATEPSKVRILTVAEAMATEAGLTGLALFHRAMLEMLTHQSRRADTNAAARLDARDAVNRRSMTGGLDRLAAVFGRRVAPGPAAGALTPLVGAFMLVCEALGRPFTAKLPDGVDPASIGVPALTRLAGIGHRQILLRENWWLEEHGPILGARGETNAPVALLPGADHRYRMVDPSSGEDRLVDDTLAASLAAGATMFYAPLPDRADGLWPLIRFGSRGNGRDLMTVLAVGLAGGILAACLPVATGILFDFVIPHAETGQIAAIVLALIAAALGAAAFDMTRAIALLRIEGRMEALLQPALMQRMLALPVRFFRDYGTGDLHDRVLALPRIRRLVAGTTIVSLLSVLFSLVSFVVILAYSISLALVSVGLVSIALVVTIALAILQLRPERAAARIGGRENALVIQLLQGIVKLRTTASEPRMFAVWSGLFAQKKTLELQGQGWANLRALFFAVYPTIATMTLFLTAAMLISVPANSAAGTNNGSLALGEFIAVNAAFGQLLAAIVAMAGALTGLLEAVPMFERVRPILRAMPETLGDKTDPGPLTGPIELSRVSFRYGAEDPMVIEDVSLRVEPGQLVAFVGASGSGKSTLLRLLLGFETPSSGDIFYQDHSITSLDATALRRRIGVVLQNGRAMTGSIYENITTGLPYSLDDAWEAARMAGLDLDIKDMPMGMHTQIMEGAPTLSGGQMQRLMIARALVGRPDVLMFDEATSALDNRSQATVTASLNKLGATRIVIAHRLSTVAEADQIFVLHRGRLVEQGSFDALMAHDGAFSALARRQLL